MKRIAILGASGHGRVVADAALAAGCESIVFFDDAWPGVMTNGAWPVVGTAADIVRTRPSQDGIVIAIGDNRTRLRKQGELIAQGFTLVSILHPAGVVSPTAEIGRGTVVFAGAVINPYALLGEACIVNTAATIDHDCVLRNGVHVSPGAHLAGGVHVGEASWIGIGAAVREGISIGAHATVAAGAAVVHDVADGVTVMGVPARPRRSHRQQVLGSS